jgi:hypothetical protein
MHRAFGGIGLFSFPVEQTIGMINMLIQHYDAGTTLAKKMSASIKALQIEIGCTGSPFVENYEELHLLATLCWTKSLWERLHYYKFCVHFDHGLWVSCKIPAISGHPVDARFLNLVLN